MDSGGEPFLVYLFYFMQTTKLTQKQREALINLLTLGMYVDNLLSLKEDESLTNTLESFDWESGVGRTVFLQDAITRARNAESDEQIAVYLQSCAAAFDTIESKNTALESLTEFLKIDGMAEAETPFVLKARQALGI